jgi:hypothetical protein
MLDEWEVHTLTYNNSLSRSLYPWLFGYVLIVVNNSHGVSWADPVYPLTSSRRLSQPTKWDDQQKKGKKKRKEKYTHKQFLLGFAACIDVLKEKKEERRRRRRRRSHRRCGIEFWEWWIRAWWSLHGHDFGRIRVTSLWGWVCVCAERFGIWSSNAAACQHLLLHQVWSEQLE